MCFYFTENLFLSILFLYICNWKLVTLFTIINWHEKLMREQVGVVIEDKENKFTKGNNNVSN